MSLLTLTASECAGPNHWHWSLHEVDAAGRRNRLLAEHDVRLNPADWQHAGWLDLHNFVRLNAAPDRRREEEQRITAEVGAWIGANVFGPVGIKLVELADDEPVTVYVTVETDADKPAGESLDEHVLFRPLELATVQGRPLSLHDISLVFDTRPLAARPGPSAEPAADKLRMLCVFSLPSGVGALNLRHERYQLRRRMLDVTRSRGLDVELRVLQYGVTRKKLGAVMKEAPGWDVVHFSGHGLASRLILEKDDGSRDDVDTADLVDLLRPTRKRLKWVTLSACLSAAATADETLRWMGLDPARLRQTEDAARDDDDAAAAEDTAKRLPVLARTVAEELNCGVLAMRFPVGDEFAIELAQQVYGGVFEFGQPLHQALRYAMADLCGPPQTDAPRRHSALAVATPTLFGQASLSLSLSPRQARAEPDAGDTPLALFPPAHERLVGRVRELTRASRALALDSDYKGVLFHGMAGGGKTACALEVAWQQEDVGRFQRFVWFKAPDAGQEITTALTNLAHALERQLGGRVAMLDKLDRRDELLAFLPHLADVLRKNSVLIVIDNLESLLREARWRDERWGDLIDALLSHDGPSRLVLTSRLAVPVGQSEFARSLGPQRQAKLAARLLTLPVHALSLDETALLARQLPGLRALLEGDRAADGFQREAHRQLVCRMLRLVQGHPKLMELADGLATDAAALEQHVTRAQEAWAAGGPPLEAFFRAGRSELDEADFLQALSDWTATVAGSLPDQSRGLFEFLCCLEEPDRTQSILLANWDDYLQRTAPSKPEASAREDLTEASPSKPEASASEDLTEASPPKPEASARTDTEPAPPDPAAVLQALTALAGDGEVSSAEMLQKLESLDGAAKAELVKMLAQLQQLQHQAQTVQAKQTQTWSALQPALESLLAAGLVERRATDGADGEEAEAVFAIHPGVAEAGRRAAGSAVQAAVDAELAAYWVSAYQHGQRTMMQGGGALVRTAGLRAAPYLIRREDWETASTLLEYVVEFDKSSATISTVLPLLRGIAKATEGTERGLIDRGILAKSLLAAGRWQDAEAETLAIAAAAEQQGAWRIASVALGEVVKIMRQTGRAEAALAVVDRMKRATANAGLGPWSQLLDDVRRLQLLNQIGRYPDVLAEVERLRQEMDGLSEQSDREETAVAWNVRETLLDTGRFAALQTGVWQQCLDLNAAILASKQARRASDLELAATRFNDYGSLLRLDRIADARRLLLECRRVYDEHNDYARLGRVLSALADLEGEVGHLDRAVDAEHSALRYKYLAGQPGDCAISHFNLANHLPRWLASAQRSPIPAECSKPDAPAKDASAAHGVSAEVHGAFAGVSGLDERTALAHRLAAACIFCQTQDGNLPRVLQALSRELSALSPSSPAAALVGEDGSGFEALAGIVEQVEGVRFRELFARLPATRAATGPEALRQVLALARQESGGDSQSEFEQLLQAILPALAAAAAAGEDIEPLLAEVRNKLRQSAPNIDESQLDALLSALRSAASDRAAGAEHGAAVPEP